MARRLRVDRLQLEPALAALSTLRWVGAMPDGGAAYLEESDPRYVLLAEPDTTLLAPLLEELLLVHSDSTAPLWQHVGWETMTLREALPRIPSNLPGDRVGEGSPADGSAEKST